MKPPLHLSFLLILVFAGCALAAPNPPAPGGDPQEITEFKARAGAMAAAAISADGKFIFTGEDDGLVTLWSVASGTSTHIYTGHSRGVFAVALLPDGKRGISAGDDDRVIIWDLATAKRLQELHTGTATPLVMAVNSEGSLAATGCDDGEVIIWDLAAGKRLTDVHHRSPIANAVFSPDGRTLAASYQDGKVILWDTGDWSARQTLDPGDGATSGALAYSPDGRLLAAGDQNGAGFVWKTADGSMVTKFAGAANGGAAPSPPSAPVFDGSTVTPENRNAIVFLTFSLDGATILTSLQDNTPRFWNSKTGEMIGTANWFQDNRFYIARFGFAYATAAVTPRRDFIVTMKENAAQVWPLRFTPSQQ